MAYRTDFSGKIALSRDVSVKEMREFKDVFDKRFDRATKADFLPPGYYCCWQIEHSGDFLEWDGGEKSYNWAEWLFVVIERFFRPKDIILNGTINWHGDEPDDTGTIIVDNNEISLRGSGNVPLLNHYNEELTKFRQRWALYHQFQSMSASA